MVTRGSLLQALFMLVRSVVVQVTAEDVLVLVCGHDSIKRCNDSTKELFDLLHNNLLFSLSFFNISHHLTIGKFCDIKARECVHSRASGWWVLLFIKRPNVAPKKTGALSILFCIVIAVASFVAKIDFYKIIPNRDIVPMNFLEAVVADHMALLSFVLLIQYHGTGMRYNLP